MVLRSEHPKRNASGQPAAPWALLWLGTFGTITWAPLLLMEKLPQPMRSTGDANPLAVAVPKQFLPPVSPLPSRPRARLAAMPTEDRPNPAGSLPLNGVEGLRQPKAWAVRTTASTTVDLARDATPLVPTTPISGSLLLGGPLGLESLREKPMVPAARVEQALRDSAADRLAVVPPQWRPAMQALLQGPERVLPAEVVRLPAPHLKDPEEYPLVVKSDGIAETTVTPPPRSKATMERWAKNVEASPPGSARPILVVLEPLQADDPSIEHQPVIPTVEPEAPQTIQ
jgi:hypothetical protein